MAVIGFTAVDGKTRIGKRQERRRRDGRAGVVYVRKDKRNAVEAASADFRETLVGKKTRVRAEGAKFIRRHADRTVFAVGRECAETDFAAEFPAFRTAFPAGFIKQKRGESGGIAVFASPVKNLRCGAESHDGNGVGGDCRRRNVEEESAAPVEKLEEVQSAESVVKRETVAGGGCADGADAFGQFDGLRRFAVHDAEHGGDCGREIIEIIRAGFVGVVPAHSELGVGHLPFGPGEIAFAGVFDFALSGKAVGTDLPVFSGAEVLRIQQIAQIQIVIQHKRLLSDAGFPEYVNRTSSVLDNLEKQR